MRSPGPVFPTQACIDCGRGFTPDAERFRINDRFWCEPCAKPYLQSPLASALRDALMVCVAMAAGCATWILIAQTVLARVSLLAGASVFAWIFAAWVMRPKVRVERVLPARSTASSP